MRPEIFSWRPLMRGTCALAAIVAAPVAGHAQVITQYFPNDLPGFAASQTDSVLTRRLFLSRHTGVPVGAFVVSPYVSQSAGWNSNILGVPGSSSPSLDTSAGLKIGTNWADQSIGVSANMLNHAYTDLSTADYTNWNTSVGASSALGRGNLTAGYSHALLHLGATDIGNFGVSYPVPYSTDDYRLSYATNFGRLALIPRLQYDDYTFGAAPAGPQRDFHSLGHKLETESLTGRWEVSKGNAIVVLGRASQAQFVSAGRASDYLNVGSFAGLDLRADPVLQYRLLVGGETRRFTDGNTPTVTTPVVEADATWTPTLLDTVLITARRGIFDPTSPFARNQVITDVRFEEAHELRRDITLQGFAETAITTARGSADALRQRRQTQFKFGLSGSWLVNRYLTATLNFSHVSSYTKGGAPILALDDNVSRATFTANSITLGLSLAE